MREEKTACSRCARKWQRQRQRQLRLRHSWYRVSCRWDRRRCVWHPLVASRQEGRMWLHHRLVRVPRLRRRWVLHRMPRLIRNPHQHLALVAWPLRRYSGRVLRGLCARGHGRLSGRGAGTGACSPGAEGSAARMARGRRAIIRRDRHRHPHRLLSQGPSRSAGGRCRSWDRHYPRCKGRGARSRR